MAQADWVGDVNVICLRTYMNLTNVNQQSDDMFLFGNRLPSEAPYRWRHAALSKMQAFLVAEKKAGRYHPLLSHGLD